MQKLWQIWKYSLGSFSDDKTKPYDNYVAIIRSIILITGRREFIISQLYSIPIIKPRPLLTSTTYGFSTGRTEN